VIAGSIPRGIPADFYGELVSGLRKHDVKTMIDAEGEVMGLALKAEPDLVTPNVVEAEELVGREFSDAEDLAAAPAELRGMGARDAIVTDEHGCWAVFGADPDVTLHVKSPVLDPVTSVGSGDALLAGFVTARYIGLDDVPALRYAVACGAESTQHFGAGVLDTAAVDQLVDAVEITAVSRPVVG
jgi:fructose-1-phosphate kinase PfkB-like protein